MHTTYYIAQATWQENKHVFVFKPGTPGTLTEDKRTVDEIESAAAEKGYEISYRFTFGNMPWKSVEEITKLVTSFMRAKYPERTLPPDAAYTLHDTFTRILVPIKMSEVVGR